MSELALIRHQIGLQRRHRPIRDLMKRSGKAIQALKPCFMMGPMSVAQYLAPGYLEFDLVIMDEASQLRPEDAIGAIARAKQAVIVGDDMQLPPTSFFDRIDDGDDLDEEEIVVGQREESVLRLAAQRFRSRMLSWHYRSRDEALIAFSNWKFYNSRLILFPSPKHGAGRTGIEFNYVVGGQFTRGVNEVEARAVAEAAVAHVKAHPTRSAIIVAMNILQRDRIRRHVDELTRGQPFLAVEEDAGLRIEPFDVKNLENVQGDERDVVFISMTYGLDPGSGRVLQRFGPINGEYGHRRLNVLFSRARKKMIVFSSMRHGDIVLAENSALGVQSLRDFLYYAETKQLRMDATPVGSGRPPGSDFEVAVAAALAGHGYDCVAQLGVAGFFLDIAVRDPDNPESFLLGVECDGATYHSTQSARDRDRLRQDVLESLGWRIERVWSTDWFTDPAAEIRRLVGCVESARATRSTPTRASDPWDMPVAAGLVAAQTDASEMGEGRASGALTKEEARQLLIALRDREIYAEQPDADRTHGLLRQSMLEALLKARPRNLVEFAERIPAAIREKTDPDQVRTYGARVFAILARTLD
jgi:very-short-patch-repair endonuclease